MPEPPDEETRALAVRARAAREHADAVGAYEGDVTTAREVITAPVPFDPASSALLDARERLAHLAALLDALGRSHTGHATRADRDLLAVAARTPAAAGSRTEPDAVRALLDDAAAALAPRAARRSERHVVDASPAELTVVTDLVERGITFDQLGQLLAGAHLLVPGHDVLARWAALDGAHPRPSSHYRDATGADAGPQYGIAGHFAHEILFGPGPHGTTFVQLERAAPSATALPRHLADWVEYRATHRNQGPYGSSAFTDARPLHLHLATPATDTTPAVVARHLGAVATALDTTAGVIRAELALDTVVARVPEAPAYDAALDTTRPALETAAAAVRAVARSLRT